MSLRRAAVCALLAASLIPNPVAAQTACAGLNAETVLVNARDRYRQRTPPPYVVYSLARVEYVDGTFSLENSYELRIWFRSSDGAALTRRVDRGRARGALVFLRPRFNAALDPGPPTADIFERAPPRPGPAEPPVAEPLHVIASLSSHIEIDYAPALVDCDRQTLHLRLRPRRDADRNRLRELWIDRETSRVRRFVATDRLYASPDGSDWVPDLLDAELDLTGAVPLIRRIHMTTDVDDDARFSGRHEDTDYRLDGAAFPATLPEWYFQPATYGTHRSDAPTW